MAVNASSPNRALGVLIVDDHQLFSDGLVHPYGESGQCRPTQRFGCGDAVIAVASSRTFDSTFVLIDAGPVSTSRIPSRPIDAVMLPEALVFVRDQAAGRARVSPQQHGQRHRSRG